jgi:HD superfamily phosphodiesterase
MQTAEWKKLAQERHDFMVQFFDRLNMEVDWEL